MHTDKHANINTYGNHVQSYIPNESRDVLRNAILTWHACVECVVILLTSTPKPAAVLGSFSATIQCVCEGQHIKRRT